MKRSGAVAVVVSLLVAAGVAETAGARDACAQDAAPYTLHVYTNLIQVPTLVLGFDLRSIPMVKREQFAISLDHGPEFKPTQMRVEGDDPISLAVLLDARGDLDDILKVFGKALGELAPKHLHTGDQVAIYAIDCAVAGNGDSTSADAAGLKAGVAAALAAHGLHGEQQRGACGSSIRLWDAIGQVVGTLGERSGRRVLLVVSNGKDGKSSSGFAETVNLAESKSVAIFGLRYWEHVQTEQVTLTGNKLTYRNNPVMTRAATATSGGDADLFDQMCESTGGLALNLWNPEFQTGRTLAVMPSLVKLVGLLRGRYILEFPRPDEAKSGLHSIDISVPRTQDVVLSTGVTYANLDPSAASDPTTVRSAPSPAAYGERRPLDRH